MPRPNQNLPAPDDFDHEARLVWFRTQTELRHQGTWRNTDAPLLEAYVRSVTAGEAETALRFASALLLTPEARARHGIAKPRMDGTFAVVEAG